MELVAPSSCRHVGLLHVLGASVPSKLSPGSRACGSMACLLPSLLLALISLTYPGQAIMVLGISAHMVASFIRLGMAGSLYGCFDCCMGWARAFFGPC